MTSMPQVTGVLINQITAHCIHTLKNHTITHLCQLPRNYILFKCLRMFTAASLIKTSKHKSLIGCHQNYKREEKAGAHTHGHFIEQVPLPTTCPLQGVQSHHHDEKAWPCSGQPVQNSPGYSLQGSERSSKQPWQLF